MQALDDKVPFVVASNPQTIRGVDQTYEPRCPTSEIGSYIKIFLHKYFHHPDKTTEMERMTLIYLMEKFLYNVEINLFRRGTSFERKLLRFTMEELSSKKKKFNLQEMFRYHCPHWLMSERAYFGRILNKTFRPVRWETRRRVERHHPSRFVGVGYNDKGSRSEPALDGTPSWAEVAMCMDTYLEKFIRRKSDFPQGRLKIPYERLTVRDTENQKRFFDVLLDNSEPKGPTRVLITGLFPSSEPQVEDLVWVLPTIDRILRKTGRTLLQVHTTLLWRNVGG